MSGRFIKYGACGIIISYSLRVKDNTSLAR